MILESGLDRFNHMPLPVPILHVINGCVDGSISRIIERIIQFSPGKDFEWHISPVTFMGDFARNFEKLGAKVVDCTPQSGDPNPAWKKINRYVKENGIQVIHSHTPRTIVESWRALHPINVFPKPEAIHLATKHLLTLPKDRKWGLAMTIFDRLTLYLPDHLITVSHHMAGEVAAQPFIRPSRVTAIPNAIPVEDYFKPEEREIQRKELGISPEMLAIGFAGRIEKVKNINLLLSAFKVVISKFPRTRLVIAGEGNLRTALEDLAIDLGIAHAVIWIGFCKNIPRFLSALDIYIQPSVNEGLSLSILEAMAAEKPVIGTCVGSAEEMLVHKQTGILIKPGNVGEIVNGLLMLISDPELRDRLAKNGREFVKIKYDIQMMVDGYYDVYRQLFQKMRIR